MKAAEQWAPADRIAPLLLDQVASTAAGLTVDPEFRTPALRTLAAAATTADHFETLREPAEHDRDLAWRVLARRAELGDYDEEAVAALEKSDLDPEAWVRALGVRARPTRGRAKDEVWSALLVDRTVPMGSSLVQVGGLFWRPDPGRAAEAVDRPLPRRAAVARLGRPARRGRPDPAAVPLRRRRPGLPRPRAELADAPGTHPAVRQNLLTGADTVRRMLAARALDR